MVEETGGDVTRGVTGKIFFPMRPQSGAETRQQMGGGAAALGFETAPGSLQRLEVHPLRPRSPAGETGGERALQVSEIHRGFSGPPTPRPGDRRRGAGR